MRQRRRGDADDGVPVSQSKSAITLDTFDLYQKVREKEDQIQTTGGATGESSGTCILLSPPSPHLSGAANMQLRA